MTSHEMWKVILCFLAQAHIGKSEPNFFHNKKGIRY